MKKVFTLTVLLITLLLTFATTKAGDRMMLVEFFTSSTCAPCASNNPIMTAFLLAQDPDKIASIGFHMNWPSPGNDPMYLHNPTDNNTRRSYYGVNAIPAGFYDGLISIPLPYLQTNLQNYYNSRKDILSPVTIIVRDSTYGDSVKVKVHVYCETYLENPLVTMHMGVIEENIHYSSPPGTNGETDFHWVMRKMLPSASGTQILLTPGYYNVFEFKYKMDPVWVSNKIRNLVYIQAQNKEILNAAKTISNFSLHLNTPFLSVPQGQATTKNLKVKIPYTAAGFNSPVTFTSEVQPSNAGITVSFPSGTTISNFPDSLNVQVNTTASVPTGTYKIVLTGTSASNKVHKIALDLLVGKNYVTVKADNNLLSIKVDNVQYLTAKLFNWDIASSHTIDANSPQTFGGTRYVFKNWSDNGDTAHSIQVNSNTSVYTAYYKTQFRILTTVQPGGLPVTFTNGNMYHDSASTVSVSVSPASVLHNGKTYYFNRWVGAGIGSYTGNDRTFQVNLHNAINQIAIYDTINVSISKLGTEIPAKYDLYQNYPNPFNPSTKIKFDIIKSGITKLTVFDITGRTLNTLVNENLEAGSYEYFLNASALPSGIYFYKLESGNFVQTKRMILIK
ncbi:MAG: T9SS type A sorting domain-containing protein [Ignavibacteria bacterium]|nr:T9SS type A sorting domain-containing protein [Ignavibacteria bacterium]